MTGLRQFIDRSGEWMAKFITIPRQLDSLTLRRSNSSTPQPLSKLLSEKFTNQDTKPKVTKISVNQLFIDVQVKGMQTQSDTPPYVCV